MADEQNPTTQGDVERERQHAAALEEVRKKLEEIRRLEAMAPEASSPMAKKIEQLREEVRLRQEAALAATRQAQAEEQAAQRAALNLPQRQPGQALATDHGPGTAFGTVPTLAQAALTGNVGQAAAALGELPGPLGMAGKALGVLQSVVSTLYSTFLQLRDSISDVIAEHQRQLGDLRSGRQTGLAGPEQLRRALNNQEFQAFTAAQEAGDRARQEQILRGAQARLNEQAAAAGPGAAQRGARLLSELDRLEAIFRRPGGRVAIGQEGPLAAFGPAARFAGLPLGIEEQRRTLLRQAGIPENMVGNIGSGPLTPEMRRQISDLAGGQAVQAQAGARTVGNILGSGIIPNLQPGAPQITDLPNLFRSQQADVLDVHAQVQQELVRDMRQEQRFQAEMALWEQILQAILGLPGGGDGGAIDDAWEGAGGNWGPIIGPG